MELESKIIKVHPSDFQNNSHEDTLADEFIKSISSRDKHTVLNNPFLDQSDIVQLVGIWDNKVVGAIKYCFPLKIRAYGKELFVASGSTLYVDEQYRTDSGMGAFLMMEKTKIHPSMNCLSAGISQLALPLYKKLKYTVFETPRMMYIKHSRTVVEHFIPVKGFLLNAISSIIDRFISYYNYVVSFRAGLSEFSCRQVNDVTPEMLKIIEEDEHPLAELHNKDWWEWILNNTISTGNVEKHLFEVCKNGKVVGFFLNKIEFYESASSRGFKNVFLGSVIEWGTRRNSDLCEYQVQLLAIKNMPEIVDAVEMTSSDKSVIRKLKKSLMMQVGNTNIAVRLKELPKGLWEDINLWRIRMAASDVSIN